MASTAWSTPGLVARRNHEILDDRCESDEAETAQVRHLTVPVRYALATERGWR
jgi:hypothetical protein